MKLSKKFIAVPALAASLSLTACGSSAPTRPSQAITAGTATINQICRAGVGTTIKNTGNPQDIGNAQDLGTTIVSTVPDNPNADHSMPVNSSGNEVVRCDYTVDTGAGFSALVTLFANGSLGVAGV